ncbi:DHHA1 domain-containing protein [Ruminococcus sp. CLA-AA-H200]|uniref:Single-stranded-DNA-specific exonuclease RecJ n=1 Tax=Ruminococcus turbiniformis TaxID=2881258 RepID=A0ABS8FWY1_9FIRM|nr:DHH family phosphoesterase [Ruminococcus turbiniformis]MCC2254560.1 DHHA1 domain-containing protein [Ruminococcus turbiniformis]
MFFKKDDCTTIEEVVQRNTGIPTAEFFADSGEPEIHNLSMAVAILKEHKDEIIHIVGDYDVDGITGTCIMATGLEKAGFRVTTRLPRRFSEGYGLSEKIIDELDSGVVLTVDNGIAAAEAINKAREKGLTVIVTDHHLPPKRRGEVILPDADIFVDPSADGTEGFKGYCGAAIAYRFVKELLGEDVIDLKVLASIATVADVMPLLGVNRKLVQEGLQLINTGHGPAGLRKLLDTVGLDNHITEEDYGFTIGPIFNASGRLFDDGAERVLKLLRSPRNNPQLWWETKRLIETNNKRKELMKTAISEADDKCHGERPAVVYLPDIGEGIVGLVAGQLCEKYLCPAICFTQTEQQGILKGSGRSIPGVDLKAVLDSIQDEMLGYGGHAGAAGLSICSENLGKFRKKFSEACGELPSYSGNTMYDLDMELWEAEDVAEELKKFSPFGEKNPKIRFRIHKFPVSPAEFKVMGDGSHFSINADTVKLVAFGMRNRFEDLKAQKGYPKSLDVVGYLGESWFNGKRQLKFEAIDFE